MGEIVEMILEGILCEKCGGIVGDFPERVGYPRLCELCRKKRRRAKPHHGKSHRPYQMRGNQYDHKNSLQ